MIRKSHSKTNILQEYGEASTYIVRGPMRNMCHCVTTADTLENIERYQIAQHMAKNVTNALSYIILLLSVKQVDMCDPQQNT